MKSDKYFQLVEAAQFDFMIKTGLLGMFLRNGYRFVNASQLIKFSRPIRIFTKLEIETGIAYWDDKCAYFEHVFSVRGEKYARVFVKVKFKKGGKTIDPAHLVGQ
ncbi:thioesterase family protein [Noviherbaspirillum cavernae]|uniref:thioesterase family protein n=1 Tax=Noviherbaspirillum cavernae TaxID=2320862 RepID=UPI001314005F|nr:thioesterase family protein [Noviherbaspirillum cavernae]